MSSPPPVAFSGRHVFVADEDPTVVALVTQTLRDDGHAVFQACDGLSAVELAFALDECHLVISNTRVDGVAGIDLIRQLRHQQPTLPVMYLANTGRSTPEVERQLPPNVPILREPFTADELRAAVVELLSRDHDQALQAGSTPQARTTDREEQATPREVRLRLDFAEVYPAMPAGNWIDAGEWAAAIVGRAQEARLLGIHRRTFDQRHFEFQGGAPARAAGQRHLRTRTDDR